MYESKVNILKCTKPPDKCLKINIAGTALTNLGLIGAGGILRDKESRIVMAFTTPLGEETNNKAEIEATIFC